MNPNNDLADVGNDSGHDAAPPRRWPRWLRRGPMELTACIVIGLGILMMLQPFTIVLYTYSFVTTLAGVVMFTIVSKFPE